MSEDITDTGKPYTDASTAIKDALDMNDFNSAAVGAGPVEIRIVGDFTETGCVIMRVAMAKIIAAPAPTPTPTPPATLTGVGILRDLADATDAPGPRYVLAANSKQVETLDEYARNSEEGATKMLVRHAVRVNAMGKSIDKCGLFTPDHAKAATQVLIDLLEAPI